MSGRAVWFAVALVVVACTPAQSSSRTVREIEGVRLDIEPGTMVEIPLRVEAPQSATTDLEVVIGYVAEGSTQAEGLEARLLTSTGESRAEPVEGTRLMCREDCGGTSLLVIELPATATSAVTVDWHATLVATGPPGTGDDVGIETDETEPPSRWRVLIDTTDGSGPVVGRLHLTGPESPGGLVRMEWASERPPGVSPATLTDQSGTTRAIAGTSTLLVPPDDCSVPVCDWSVLVASLDALRVSATTNEFSASITPLEGRVTGFTEWDGLFPAGAEELQFEVEATTPLLSQASDLGLLVQIRWPADRDWDQPVTITLAGAVSRDDRFNWTSPIEMISLTCDDVRCVGATTVTVETSAGPEDRELSLRLGGLMATVPPVEGAITLELRP